MKYFIILTSLFLTGCPENQSNVTAYQLHNGDTVRCESITIWNCGAILSNCSDKREYVCQNNFFQYEEGIK